MSLSYDNIPLAVQPLGIKVKLFKHQLASIYKMERLEQEQLVSKSSYIKETRLGVNGDPTGFGKTYAMLGLIVRDKMEWNTDLPFVNEIINVESGGLIKTRTIKRYERLPTTLILVSSSIIGQWEQELSNTDLRFTLITNKREVEYINVEDYDVVLVTTSMYNNLIMSYRGHAWKRFIFDEPGHTRVTSMKEIQAGFIWFVTATPNSIITKHSGCRNSMIKTIIGENECECVGQFDDITIKNDIHFVKLSFEMPTTNHHYYKCFQPIVNTLDGLVKPDISRMLEAGNIEGVINYLGGSKTDNIVDLVKTKKLDEVKSITKKITDTRQSMALETISEDTGKERISNLEIKKEQVERQIKDLEERFQKMLQGSCIICMNKINKPVLEPSCQNLFCGDCLFEWLKKHDTCPTCRIKINPKNLIYVKSNNTDDSNQITKERKKTKLEMVIDIITSKPEGKFLIYSAYDETFKPICNILKENKISFVMLKGNHNSKQAILNDYKQGDIKVIFLNSNCNSAGLNLQETTDIILYHDMLSSTQTQIIGRAERIGRVGVLNVHHLSIEKELDI